MLKKYIIKIKKSVSIIDETRIRFKSEIKYSKNPNEPNQICYEILDHNKLFIHFKSDTSNTTETLPTTLKSY